ncbi:11631_t:CDS:2 [Scutellospora calospora]|uniref:11631_t:CDS:1 n=1 Tax=Scutellospora calospora TaxID=85575 RepID=A0ACA9LKZ8_9GLOM|nr:11631_t:CDS:2 [Scutellospora calospora]
MIVLSIIPGPNKPSKHQINNYLVPIVDELVKFSKGINILVIYEYKEGQKIYIALILSVNDVPAARKISGYTSHAIKYHQYSKYTKYDNISKRNHYSSFDNIDE